MEISHSSKPLDSDAAWSDLECDLGGANLAPVNSIIRHLRALDVCLYVLEDPYIDRDYSADYNQFYSSIFHAYERHCKRVHFFSEDISQLFQRPLSTTQLNDLSNAAKGSYCGFCVVRPLPASPVGRTVLSARLDSGSNMEAAVTCRADIDVHLLGMELQVTGTSFIQQDSRVGACAQVAIWAGMRHMHTRHNYNWISVADITRFAGLPSKAEASSLPNASNGLSTNAMVRAIAKAGYQPLYLSHPDIGYNILPYVDSGIPVILGLNMGGMVSHAVTVVGRVFAQQENPATRAFDYIPAYVVHDDQNGPYMWLPADEHASSTFSFSDNTIKCNTPSGYLELNVRSHAVFAVALMPTRVFSTATRAEDYASRKISDILRILSSVRGASAESNILVNENVMDELRTAYEHDNVVLRTYLTSAAGYRRHFAEGSASDALKDKLLHFHLPHFIWVTEISTIESYNQPSPSQRRVYGHTVLDATSTAKHEDALLLLHLPGLLLTQDLQAQDKHQFIAINDDKLYECREKRL